MMYQLTIHLTKCIFQNFDFYAISELYNQKRLFLFRVYDSMKHIAKFDIECFIRIFGQLMISN